jgi:hypothetical protein
MLPDADLVTPRQENAHCSGAHVVTPESTPNCVQSANIQVEPSPPLSSIFLCHANKFAARVTSLLQPSPSAKVHIGFYDVDEEHTIVFDEKEHVMSANPVVMFEKEHAMPEMPSTPMTMLSLHDEEQVIVFEMEDAIVPVRLFPLAMPAVASIDGVTHDDGGSLATDAAQVLPSDEGFDFDSGGEDVLYDPGTDPNGHLTWLHLYRPLSKAYPVPSATLQGLYNTVTLLPPANGPPHHLINMSSQFRIHAIHHCRSHASRVDCCAPESRPVFDPHSGVLHLDDPLGIKSRHNYLDHGESQPILANLLPENQTLTASYGENQPKVNYGECRPAIKDHSKDLDNDGEITTKLISTIATDDPITNAPNDSTCLSLLEQSISLW